MNRKSNQSDGKSVFDANEIDALYVEFLKLLYGRGNHEQAKEIAARLENAFAASPAFSESIRGEEIRSLIAEWRGDFNEAIRSREAEIRKILELHALTIKTPSWKYVVRQYDFSDVSDRLDLLAILCDRHGETERAIATLRESQSYCNSHEIPFDGQDLLDEIEQGRHVARKNGRREPKQRRKRKTAS